MTFKVNPVAMSEKTSLVVHFNNLGTVSFGPTEKRNENYKGMFRSNCPIIVTLINF